MNDVFRQYLVDRLQDSVGRIGVRFERFGTRFIDYYISEPLEHRGLDGRGLPVGHTVDSVSADGRVVAEYGAVRGYFTGSLEKPIGDWRHVRELHPGARHVLLVTNERCGPKAHSTLVCMANRAKELLAIELEILDAAKIATFIVDRLLPDDEAVETLADFVPVLSELRDEYVATHLAPKPVADYLKRVDIERTLVDHMKNERVATLAGFSGTGKSQMAAAVAAAMWESKTCGIVVWIDAREVDSVDALRGVVIDRRGRRANALALTHITSCLLVLDDLKLPIDRVALAEACGDEAYVLITRQTIEGGDLQLPWLEEGEARMLLQHGLPESVPEAVFNAVWQAVGGHALSLRLLGSTAGLMGSWEGLIPECDHIAEYKDEARHRRVADRLLERMRETAPRELAFFQWSGGTAVDPGLALDAVGFHGLEKLRAAGLVAVDS